MCAATVDTPEPDTKWTQQPDCVAKHEMRTHTVTSPNDLRKDSTAKGCGVADGGREGRRRMKPRVSDAKTLVLNRDL